MNPKDLFKLHEELTKEALEICKSKNHDYAGTKDAFANFRGSTALGIHPVLGIQLRLQDKMMRVKTYTEKGQLHVQGESVRDAVLDSINYLILMYGLIEEDSQEDGEPDGNYGGIR